MTSLSLLTGARLGAGRLRVRASWIVALLAVLCAAALAVVHRGPEPLAAPDRALIAIFRYVIPLVAFGVVSLATARQKLALSVWCFARHGVPRQGLAFGVASAAALSSAALCWACAAVGLVVAYGGRAGLAADLLTTTPIALLGGAAYAAWFALGAAFLRAGRGKLVVLLVDFTLGAGSGVVAALFPRAHLRSLIGGERVMDLPQANSSVLLLAMTIALIAVAAQRVGR